MTEVPAPDGEGRSLRVVSVVVCAAFAWILANVLVEPRFGLLEWSRLAMSLLALVLVFVMVVGAVVTRAPVGWLERHRWVRRLLVLVCWAALVGVQLRTGYATRFTLTWDPGVIEDRARLVALGEMSPEVAGTFFAPYPNNLLLVAAETRIFELWDRLGYTDPDLAMVLVNTAALSLSVLLAYLTARRIARPAAAYVVALLCFAFVGISPWIGVVYSDTVGMLFATAVAYLFVHQQSATRPSVRVALWAAMGLVAVLGYRVKPTVVFALVAALMVAALTAGLRSWSAAKVGSAAAALVAVLLGVAAGTFAADRFIDDTGLTPPETLAGAGFPITHFLKMGAQQGPGVHNDYYGAYDPQDAADTLAEPEDARFRRGWEVYTARVSEMGPLGYATFLNAKAAWFLGDGTFFTYGEGSMAAEPTPFVHADPTSRLIQSWLGLHGAHFGLVSGAWQALWLAVLALVTTAAVLRGRAVHSAPATMMRVTLAMLVVFLLLFESRSRYVYLFLPYFLLLAGLSVDELGRRLSSRWTRAKSARSNEVMPTETTSTEPQPSSR